MLGSRNSVVSRLKERQPSRLILHCVCHISHLMVVMQSNAYVTDMTGNLFWWFHQSSKRVDKLRSFQEWLEVEAHQKKNGHQVAESTGLRQSDTRAVYSSCVILVLKVLRRSRPRVRSLVLISSGSNIIIQIRTRGFGVI